MMDLILAVHSALVALVLALGGGIWKLGLILGRIEEHLRLLNGRVAKVEQDR